MFENRSSDQEIMDDLDFSDPVIFQTLKEIDTINAWLGGNNVTLGGLKEVFKENSDKYSWHIADLGCGSGEMLRQIGDLTKRKAADIHLEGIDANPHIVDYAREKSLDYTNLKYSAINIFSPEFAKRKFDIVTCTLFCHHFEDKGLSDFLRTLQRKVSTAIIINDIHRHWFAYYSIKWLTAIFSKSYMVKYDARLSVLKAFKRKELEQVLQNAGISDYTIKWKWAFRYQVIIKGKYCPI